MTTQHVLTSPLIRSILLTAKRVVGQHPRPLEEDWGLGSREYSTQGINREQPLFAFRCDGTAGLCLIDSGATLNLVSKDFTEKAGLETRPPEIAIEGVSFRRTTPPIDQRGETRRRVLTHLAAHRSDCRAVTNDEPSPDPRDRVGPVIERVSYLARASTDHPPKYKPHV